MLLPVVKISLNMNIANKVLAAYHRGIIGLIT